MIKRDPAPWFDRAQKVLVGGVNSPVRSFSSVGGTPPFIARAQGPYLWDEDGNRYIDLVQSWGAMILGHGHPEVLAAARRALNSGTSFGACHRKEIELAEMICEAFPKTSERVRFMSSGTEATMTALRIARGATGRELVIKFSGCYHGHHDSLLAAAGSGVLTLGIPTSQGVPASWTKSTLVLPYNSPEAVSKTFARQGNKIAAVIVEPVACNMGLTLPQKGFLKTLRAITKRHGAVLIFDEVITGFRLKWGGVSDDYGADLVCLGKIIGGGFPMGAVAGKKELMNLLSPLGGVYHAGTLSGNPVAAAAGLATLHVLKRDRPYNELEVRTKKLAASLKGKNITVTQLGGLLTIFFTPTPVTDYESAKTTDTKRFARFFNHLLKAGIYWPPSNFEACFFSTAHSSSHLKILTETIAEALEASCP